VGDAPVPCWGSLRGKPPQGSAVRQHLKLLQKSAYGIKRSINRNHPQPFPHHPGLPRSASHATNRHPPRIRRTTLPHPRTQTPIPTPIGKLPTQQNSALRPKARAPQRHPPRRRSLADRRYHLPLQRPIGTPPLHRQPQRTLRSLPPLPEIGSRNPPFPDKMYGSYSLITQIPQAAQCGSL
jgi:hypothetical protein